MCPRRDSNPHIKIRNLVVYPLAYEGNSGGGGEIRTHDTLRYTGFRNQRTRPLCDPTKYCWGSIVLLDSYTPPVAVELSQKRSFYATPPLVPSAGFEPTYQDPQSCGLSISLRGQQVNFSIGGLKFLSHYEL